MFEKLIFIFIFKENNSSHSPNYVCINDVYIFGQHRLRVVIKILFVFLVCLLLKLSYTFMTILQISFV